MINLLENIRKECVSKGVDNYQLSELMGKVGEKYISQFNGEMKAANALALGALLAGDASPYDFANLSQKMVEMAKNNSKNYFEILLEECKKI